MPVRIWVGGSGVWSPSVCTPSSLLGDAEAPAPTECAFCSEAQKAAAKREPAKVLVLLFTQRPHAPGTGVAFLWRGGSPESPSRGHSRLVCSALPAARRAVQRVFLQARSLIARALHFPHCSLRLLPRNLFKIQLQLPSCL